MNVAKLKYFKEKLLNEKKETLKAIERMDENEPNESFQEYFGELSVYDNHPADIATETFQMEMNFNLKNNEKLYLQEVEEAIERFETGVYGKCDTCGENIPEARLEVMPTTKNCIGCEKKNLHIAEEIHTRPVEEETLEYPFGRTYMDANEDYNGFDGEDTWQAVARFNKTEAQDMALDWYDNNMYDENVSGTVEYVDNISNDFYMGQLEDVEREDIPDRQKKNIQKK
ncbi:TraR/DksA C4-type zinc finger protein [Marinisporobacter balticus]|uniref:TraR/DksA family transcriptional regulator n=1 Tax=Marinisporobacter balticus TaxID=2018667 RepID=A0A4R2L1B3_9FIRM|nr:TraR/DksA C4-type zinc finger protein [Marinisporobacter balticus]TCO78967.1 TraR/DksA family transcriptional regulator [Marinisporobacter balticus]